MDLTSTKYKNFLGNHHLLIGTSIIKRMIRKTQNSIKSILLLVFLVPFLSACTGSESTSAIPVLSSQVIATPKVENTVTLTPFGAPTIEPGVPLAASVNGQGITIDEFQAEFELAQTASETGLVVFTEEDVLQNLIDEVLLEQGAAKAGYTPDEMLMQTRIEQLGIDDQAVQDWLTQNGYTQVIFKRKFLRANAAAWMRDEIMSSVSKTTEQVNARQILLSNATLAENVYAQLQSGTDFATLAIQYDPLSSGDLGWFPRGYLTVPELDDPIFSLQPGAYTEIIETQLGYHIVQVIDRDTQRTLSPEALTSVQIQAVQNWLIEHRSQSEIKILLP
jgi:peptidyl-prolyl cis-trans isomerase C